MIFRQAGKVRELQLEIGLLKQFGLYNFLKGYTILLERRLKRESNHFFDLTGPWLKEKLRSSHHHFSPHFDKADRGEVDDFLEKQRSSIRAILANRYLATDQIHLLRKKCKEFYYTSRIFMDDAAQFEKIDRFQELLGDWHDTVIMQTGLQKALAPGELPPAETHRVTLLKLELERKEKKLYEIILRSKDDFSRALRVMPVAV